MNVSTFFSNDCVAEVMKDIDPRRGGRIFYEATDWPAQYADSTYSDALPIGSQVEVVGRRGITQLVKPL